MLVNNQLTIYDSWDIFKPCIPTRSRLFQLEPIGIGTHRVESLTSYIARLAEAHCLLTRTLISEIIAPQLQQTFVKRCTSRGLGALFEKAKTINGNGNLASDFIQALEKLTFRQDLQLLTLLTWSNVINSKGLFRNHKAWCPSCYQESFARNKIVYEPLIWSFQAVEVCPIHSIYLSNACPHCHNKLPLFTWHSRLGFCSNCSKSLIQPVTDSNIQESLFHCELKKLIWKADSLGSLIALTPKVNLSPSRDIFISNLNSAINVVTEGNVSNFASLLQMPKNTVWGWSRGKVFPSIDALLKIAWLLKISLADLLTKEIEIINLKNISTKSLNNTSKQQRSSPSNFNYERIEKVLLEILNQAPEEISTIKNISDELGCNRRILDKHFRELCHAIVVKRRNFEKINHQRNIQDCCQEVKQAAIDLYQKGIYPTEASVSKIISRPGFFRYKQVRDALHKTKRKLGL